MEQEESNMEKSQLEKEQLVEKCVASFRSRGRYKKGSSAGSKGTEYQVGLLTIVLLNSLRNLSNWRLSTENASAGKFDDVVVEWPQGAILIQAKHKEKKKKGITLEELMSVNSKRDEFSLPKYFLYYLIIKKNFEEVSNVIICTNLDVNHEVLPFLNAPTLCSESVLNHQIGFCYFYTFNDDILTALKESTKSYYRHNFQNKDVQEWEITNENLKDFLKHLQFYFQYPPQDNMGKVIEKLLSLTVFSSNVTAVELSSKIRRWFQKREGEYFSEIHAKAAFSEIRSDKYLQNLEQLNILFENNSFSFKKTKKVLQVVPQKGYLLQVLKIVDALQSHKSKTLCTDPKDGIEALKQAVDAFELPSYTTLLIIWFEDMEEPIAKEISDKLKFTMNRYVYKNLVLVAKNSLLQKLEFHDCCDVVKESVTLLDLAKDTQEVLLSTKNIKFQGQYTNLEEVFARQMSTDQKIALGSEILEKLILGEKVNVGSKVLPLEDHIAPYYVDRTFETEIEEGNEQRWTDAKRKELYSENNIYEVNEKLVLIQDIAGAGKSTVLAHLACIIKNMYPYLWVILVKLNEYTQILNETKVSNKEAITLEELLNSKSLTKLSNNLENIVFYEPKKVVLLIDGVDEISPDYTDLVLNLLARCQKEDNFAKVFLTTRPHTVHQLENILNVKSFKLQPFTDQSQLNFITNYWCHHLRLNATNRKKCERYAEQLLRKTSSSTDLYTKQHFAAIPLQVVMLAQIFQESSKLQGCTDWEGCKEFLSGSKEAPKLPERMNMAVIYHHFLQAKRDIFKVKANSSGNTLANFALNTQFDDCLAYHRRLALQEILHESECQLFSEYSLDVGNKEVVMTIIPKIGIVEKSGNCFYFCHRTFAEYFVAESILKEFQLQVQDQKNVANSYFEIAVQFLRPQIRNREKEFQKFFFDRILPSPEFGVVRSFFDSLLQKVVDSLPSTIFQYYESMSYEVNLWNNYNLVHQLVQEGCISTLQLLFKCINFTIIKDKEVEIKDLFDNSFICNNTINILKFLTQQGGVNIKAGKTPLFCAVESGHLEMVKFLVHHGAQVLSCIIHEAIRQNDEDVVRFLLETIMEDEKSGTEDPIIPYTLAYLGRASQLKDMVENGLDVNSRAENDDPLIFGAAHGGQVNTIQYLVEQGADVNSLDMSGNTALHVIAGKSSCVKAAELLVKLGVDVNAKDGAGNTALHYSVKNLGMVELLINSGLDVNSTDRSGKTALWEAIWWRQLDTIKCLVAHGCDINIVKDGGRNVLHLAAEQGELDFVRYFLSSCPGVVISHNDVNVKDQQGNTPLHSAAFRGKRDVAECLLDFGADANQTNSVGYTPLHVAAFWGRLNTVRFLVKHTDLNKRDNNGCTPLHLTIHENRLEIVESLIDHGADVNVGNNQGSTVLHLAASKGLLTMVKYLVEHFENVDIKDHKGRTALHRAVIKGHSRISKYLVEHHADVNAKDAQGYTVFHLIGMKDGRDVIKFCIEHSADINARDSKGSTALHLASRKCHFHLVKCLLEYSADINSRDSEGNTALHSVLDDGKCIDMVKLLVDKGVDVSLKNFDGITAYALAKRRGYNHLLEYLRPKIVPRNVES